MRQPEDILRSLQRYLSQIAPDYNIYISVDEGEFERPALVIRTLGDAQIAGTWHTQEITQAYALSIYPEDAESQRRGRQEADRVLNLLQRALSLGDGTQEAGPVPGRFAWRIPLWDWDGVDLGVENPNVEFEYVAVDRRYGVPGRALPDSVDPRKWSASLSCRIVWVRHAPVISSPTVESVGIQARHVT